MPWIADEIELHLQAGRRKQDDLKDRQKLLFDGGDTPIRYDTDDDLSEPYSVDEQMDAALEILEMQICGRVDLIKDCETILKDFDLRNVNLAITDDEGNPHPLLKSPAYGAAAKLKRLLPEIRAWLENNN